MASSLSQSVPPPGPAIKIIGENRLELYLPGIPRYKTAESWPSSLLYGLRGIRGKTRKDLIVGSHLWEKFPRLYRWDLLPLHCINETCRMQRDQHAKRYAMRDGRNRAPSTPEMNRTMGGVFFTLQIIGLVHISIVQPSIIWQSPKEPQVRIRAWQHI